MFLVGLGWVGLEGAPAGVSKVLDEKFRSLEEQLLNLKQQIEQQQQQQYVESNSNNQKSMVFGDSLPEQQFHQAAGAGAGAGALLPLTQQQQQLMSQRAGLAAAVALPELMMASSQDAQAAAAAAFDYNNAAAAADYSTALQQPFPSQSQLQQQKRLVYWQPMKKSADTSREQLIRAIESRLAEVIHAGEKLGISADELLTHLKMRNAMVPR
ncbi:unnamed protein product [Anisakis simplex]|uniref:Uncharacterized protein n=1 Tax=Anisakis simplex TaxID=6269 RepID=A0A0M3IZH9_ANISI|nr:unnamed protein product [Anisakis simplex]